MKKAVSVYLSIVGALFLAMLVPMASYAGGSSYYMDVAESQDVDTGGPRFVAASTSDYMNVAESQKVDTSGSRFESAPTKYYMDVAESQDVDSGCNRVMLVNVRCPGKSLN